MEIIIKLFISAFLLYSLYWLWTNQIDPTKSARKLLNTTTPSFLETRDPNILYLNGNPVGRITDNVIENQDVIIFSEVADSQFEIGNVIEWKRYKLKVVHIEQIFAMHIPKGKNITMNVKCEIL